MSKFCGVISNAEEDTEQKGQKILEFKDLNIQADLLATETKEMVKEFKVKSDFEYEQSCGVIHNEAELNDIHTNIEKLNKKLSSMELTSKQREAQLDSLEEQLGALEQTVDEFSMAYAMPDYNGPCEPMLTMLESIAKATSDLEIIVEYISAETRCVQPLPTPYSAIASIMDCHLHFLVQTDNSIDQLEKLSSEVATSFNAQPERIDSSDSECSTESESDEEFASES